MLFGKRKVSWKARLLFWGAFFGVLATAYYWQPQRFEFFPPEAPKLARVMPEELGLFRTGVRVLIVTGHPDDSEFYSGGTLLTLAESGAMLRLVAMTDGDKSYYPFNLEGDLRETRREEQRQAAAKWKGDVVFLGYMDGRLPVNDDTVSDLLHVIEEFKPDIVMTQDVLFRPRTTHSDHIDAGRNTLRALEKWGQPCWVMLYNTRAPNLYVEIEKHWFGKQELIQLHKSQFFGDRIYWVNTFLSERAEKTGEAVGQGMSEGSRAYKFQP